MFMVGWDLPNFVNRHELCMHELINTKNGYEQIALDLKRKQEQT